MDTSGTRSITRNRPIRTCRRCRARRIQCNQGRPACANCVKAGAACNYPADDPRAQVDPVKQLEDRLQYMENLVRRLRIENSKHVRGAEKRQGEEGGRSSSGTTPDIAQEGESQVDEDDEDVSDPDASTASDTSRKGYMLSGQYYGPASFFASVVTEPGQVNRLVEQDVHEKEDDTLRWMHLVPGHPHHPGFSMEHGQNTGISILQDQARVLWFVQRYMDFVHPVVHILHRPNFTTRLQEYYKQQSPRPLVDQMAGPRRPASFATSDHFTSGAVNDASQREQVPPQTDAGGVGGRFRGFEALLLSMVVLTVNVIQFRGNLTNEEESYILYTTSEYKDTACKALAAAGDVGGTTLEAIQASALMISAIRVSDPAEAQALWIRLGIVIRIAQAQGLHRDGSQFGMGPIQTELRRRTWNLIALIDTYCAETMGFEPTIPEGSYDTKLPLNVSDDELEIMQRGWEATAQRGQGLLGDPKPPFGDTLSTRSSRSSRQTSRSRSARSSPQLQHRGFTEITLARIYYQHMRLEKKVLFPPFQPEDALPDSHSRVKPVTNQVKTAWIDQLEERWHEEYSMAEWDKQPSLQKVVADTTRLLLAKTRFWNNLQRYKSKWDGRGGDRDSMDEMTLELDRLFSEAVENVEQHVAYKKLAAQVPSACIVGFYIDQHAPAFLLNTLAQERFRPTEDERARAALEELIVVSKGIGITKHLWKLFGAVGPARPRREPGSTSPGAPLYDSLYGPTVSQSRGGAASSTLGDASFSPRDNLGLPVVAGLETAAESLWLPPDPYGDPAQFQQWWFPLPMPDMVAGAGQHAEAEAEPSQMHWMS